MRQAEVPGISEEHRLCAGGAELGPEEDAPFRRKHGAHISDHPRRDWQKLEDHAEAVLPLDAAGSLHLGLQKITCVVATDLRRSFLGVVLRLSGDAQDGVGLNLSERMLLIEQPAVAGDVVIPCQGIHLIIDKCRSASETGEKPRGGARQKIRVSIGEFEMLREGVDRV